MPIPIVILAREKYSMIVVQSLLLAVHLLAMNVASAGPLAAVFLQFFGGRSHEQIRRLGQKIATVSLACFATGIVLGLLSGWILWTIGEERFFQAIARFPSKIFFGLWELAFYALCMIVYIGWWRLLPPKSLLGNVALALVGLAASTNLLWHFPALMTAIAHVAATEPSGEVLDASAFRALIFQEPVMSRWLHVWMASFATSGLVMSWFAAGLLNSRSEDAAVASVCAWGGRVALVATLLQIPIGMWLLLSSPQSEQSRLMGGDLIATGLFLASMIAALALLHQLAAIAMGNGTLRNVKLAALLLILTVIFMSATLLLARGDAFREADAQTTTPHLITYLERGSR